MSLTIHCKYKYLDSTAQRAEDWRQKFHFWRLPLAVNVMLNLTNAIYNTTISVQWLEVVSDVSKTDIELSLDDQIPKNTQERKLAPRLNGQLSCTDWLDILQWAAAFDLMLCHTMLQMG